MNNKNEKNNYQKTFSNSMKSLHQSEKQILFDMDKGKYYLKNNDNIKIIESNLFGKKKAQVNIEQTGIAKYSNRINTNSIEKLNFKIDNSLYHPQTSRFEGYSQFPRPLITPFANSVSKTKLQKNLIKEITKTDAILTVQKNKNVLNKKTNEGLPYYSGTINNLVNTKNREYVLKKINDGLTDNKNLLEKRDKTMDNILNKLKKNILTNSTNTIFGRKLKKPDNKFVEQFNINYNIYFNYPIKKQKNKNVEKDSKVYFRDLYEALNKDRVKKKLNIRKKEKAMNSDIKNKSKNESNSFHKNVIKEYVYHTPRNNIVQQNENKKMINTDQRVIQNYCHDKNRNYLDTIMKNKNKFNTVYKLKEKYDNLSTNDKKEEMSSIRTLTNIYQKCNLEKKLLNGFIKPIIKEVHFRKTVPKYNSTANIYKKEMELYKIVNPIRHKLDEERKMKELKLIQEKVEKERDFDAFYMSKSRKNKNISKFYEKE